MVGASNHEERIAAISRSLKLIIQAMDILDGYDGPPDALVHLELARQRLTEVVKDKPGV